MSDFFWPGDARMAPLESFSRKSHDKAYSPRRNYELRMVEGCTTVSADVLWQFGISIGCHKNATGRGQTVAA